MSHNLLRRAQVVCAAVVCGFVALDAGLAKAQPLQTAPVRTAYVIDFSDSHNKGVPSGNFDNFAFTINLKSPIRKLSLKRGETLPDLVATYDYADCTKGQERTLERPLASLKAGDSAWIDYIDIELHPHPQRDVRWRGGVCYGTRGPSGKWQWNLLSTPLAYDATTGRVRARVWIKDGPITAIKLVFDDSVPRQYTERVILVARPYGDHTRN
jgi:hypothetical protein